MIIESGATCELCANVGGELVWEDTLCRVILVGGREGALSPGYCRVIWGAHVGEMSDLPAQERRHLMGVVFAAEVAVRRLVRPHKINLASLGNVVPHLHWHVVPRWRDDSHFPAPVWTDPCRDAVARPLRIEAGILHDALVAALGEERGGGLA